MVISAFLNILQRKIPTMSLFMIHDKLTYKYLEHWNRQKILSNIRQHFSYLLDEWIAKKCKKIFFRGGFFLKSTLSVLRCTWTGRINLSTHEKRFRMLERIFCLFQCARNIWWVCTRFKSYLPNFIQKKLIIFRYQTKKINFYIKKLSS